MLEGAEGLIEYGEVTERLTLGIGLAEDGEGDVGREYGDGLAELI